MDNLTIQKGHECYKNIVPFINKVFKNDFIKIQSKIYNHDEYTANHFVVKDNQKIVGNLLSFPIDYHCNGQIIKSAGIGNVAVAKSARGKSLMSKMMTAAVADASKNGIDYMFLAGYRKRYERFGFVPCNTTMQFTLEKENVQHTKEYADVTFERVLSDNSVAKEIENLYNQQPSRYERKYFFEVMKTWNNHKIYAILAEDKVIGHISSGNGVIADFNVISDSISAKDVLINFYKKIYKSPRMKVCVYPNRKDIVDSLSELCQEHSSVQCGMINIINYKRCLEVLLNMYRANIDWRVVLEIKDVCNLDITAKDGVVTIVDTTKPANIALPKGLATIIMTNSQLAFMHGLPFCLPLYITNPDDV